MNGEDPVLNPCPVLWAERRTGPVPQLDAAVLVRVVAGGYYHTAGTPGGADGQADCRSRTGVAAQQHRQFLSFNTLVNVVSEGERGATLVLLRVACNKRLCSVLG